MGINEKRNDERYESNLFVDLQNLAIKTIHHRGVVIDVSLSGLAVETEADLELGEEFECHIEIPLHVKAKVVRRLSKSAALKRYGLRMLGQGLLDKLLLKKVLKGKRRTRKV